VSCGWNEQAVTVISSDCRANKPAGGYLDSAALRRKASCQPALKIARKKRLTRTYSRTYTSIMFERDKSKARQNEAKHRVSFTDTFAVFEDPNALTLD